MLDKIGPNDGGAIFWSKVQTEVAIGTDRPTANLSAAIIIGCTEATWKQEWWIVYSSWLVGWYGAKNDRPRDDGTLRRVLLLVLLFGVTASASVRFNQDQSGLVNCPTRWSLLFIFGFLCWSSCLGIQISESNMVQQCTKSGHDHYKSSCQN